MSRLISRDPFARQELHREMIAAMGSTCSWCGGLNQKGKLHIYWTEDDGYCGRRIHNGQFCSIQCHNCYHGG